MFRIPINKSIAMSVSRAISSMVEDGLTWSTFDFVNNVYIRNGKTSSLDKISEYIRLSSATMWQDGKLVEVADNVPRNSGEGWLVEEQRTNLYYQNAIFGGISGSGSTFTRIDGPNPEFGKFIHVEGAGSSVTPAMTIPVQEGRRYTLSVYSDKPTPLLAYLWGAADGGYVNTVVTPVGGGLYRHTRPVAVAPGDISSRPHFSGVSGHTLGWIQVEEGAFPTSYIPTEGAPETRSPDILNILNIPLLPTQTITGDWDAGVTHTVTDGIATFTGHGYIRNITVDVFAKYLDFENDRYSANGVPSDISSLSSFARLSSATMWQANNLIDVPEDTPRISSAGLLLEDSTTELIPNNSALTSINTEWAATSIPDTQIGNSFEFVSNGTTPVIYTEIPAYPNGNVRPSSGYYYRSILAKKSSTDSFLALGSESPAVAIIIDLKNGMELYVGAGVVKSKISYIGEYYLIEFLATEDTSDSRLLRIHASNNIDPITGPIVPTIGYKVTLALPSFRDTADFPKSVVKTSGTQVTRSNETLIVPFTAGQTVIAVKDAGVTMTIVDNNAVFEGHGYIRSIRVN